MSATARWTIAAILALASGAATSQTVYRCGDVYSRDPCSDAKAIEVDGRTSAAQRAEARQVAVREKRLADEMTHDRRLAEAEPKPALASALGPAKVVAAAPTLPKKPSKKKRNATPSDEGRDFVASVPKVRNTPS